MVRRAVLLVVLCAAAVAVAAQEQEAAPQQIDYTSIAIFNQHLYYSTFQRPRALAFDREHNELIIADSGNGLISIHKPDGAEIFVFSSKEYARDVAKLAVAPHDQIAIIEGDRSRVRLFDYHGKYKGDLPLPGLPDKPILGGIAFDGEGLAYVGENRTRQVFVYKPDGTLKFQFGSSGTDEGQFQAISGIAIADDGSIFVIDQRAICVQMFDHEGNFVRGWGRHELGAANFSLPSGVAVDSQGHVFVSDELRHAVKIFTAEGKFLGQAGGLGDAQGQMTFPTDVAAAADGRIFVSERTNSRVQVFAPAKQ